MTAFVIKPLFTVKTVRVIKHGYKRCVFSQGIYQMTSRYWTGSLAALVVTAALMVPAAAETNTGTNRVERSAPRPGTIQAYALAHELYAFGKATKNALAVVTAAAMLARVNPTDTKREKTTEGTPAANGGKKPTRSNPDLAAMLATARELAGNNQTLLAMIDDLAASGSRTALDGPHRTTTGVLGKTTDVFRVTYKGGEAAEVFIQGDGDTDLDLFVFDENGNEVCRDQVHDDTFQYCKWTPRWTGPFEI